MFVITSIAYSDIEKLIISVKIYILCNYCEYLIKVSIYCIFHPTSFILMQDSHKSL